MGSPLIVLVAAAVAAEPVPLLVAPFDGQYQVGNHFDHGGPSAWVQLTWRGTEAYGKKGHAAYDFGLPVGTPVLAAAPGKVIVARDQGAIRCPDGRRPDRSLVVRLLHEGAPDGHDYVTIYLHLDDLAVTPGQLVTAGQLIGHSGTTGCSSGPHLHFGVLRVTDPATFSGPHVDPYGWSGAGADPYARQAPSAWMWLPGREPPLIRHAKSRPVPVPLGPVRMVGTDQHDPVGGEWVELSLDPTAAPRTLAGLALTDDAGTRVPLPPVPVVPGGTVRVWTRRPAGETTGVSLDRSDELWDDRGDCARLVDEQGQVLGALRFGRGPDPKCVPTIALPPGTVAPPPDPGDLDPDEGEALAP